MMEFNPDKNRLGFYKQEEEIQLDDSHFEPLFFANDIEELRNNQNARKALKQYQIFTGQNQAITKPTTQAVV